MYGKKKKKVYGKWIPPARFLIGLTIYLFIHPLKDTPTGQLFAFILQT